MTAFQFMSSAFFILVGIACSAAVLVIVYGVGYGFIKVIKGARKNVRKQRVWLRGNGSRGL